MNMILDNHERIKLDFKHLQSSYTLVCNARNLTSALLTGTQVCQTTVCCKFSGFFKVVSFWLVCRPCCDTA
jgi:hypothetical protein